MHTLRSTLTLLALALVSLSSSSCLAVDLLWIASEAAGFERQSHSIDAEFLGALRPGEPANYLAWREAPLRARVVDSVGRSAVRRTTPGARPGEHTTLASTGSPCGEGSPSCQVALDSLTTEPSTIVRAPPVFHQYLYLAITRGDSVFAVTSPKEVARFLAPVDAAAEVVLLLTFEEGPPEYVRAGPGDGFTVLDKVRVRDCPVTQQIHLIRVSPDGRTRTIARGWPRVETNTCI